MTSIYRTSAGEVSDIRNIGSSVSGSLCFCKEKQWYFRGNAPYNVYVEGSIMFNIVEITSRIISYI